MGRSGHDRRAGLQRGDILRRSDHAPRGPPPSPEDRNATFSARNAFGDQGVAWLRRSQTSRCASFCWSWRPRPSATAACSASASRPLPVTTPTAPPARDHDLGLGPWAVRWGCLRERDRAPPPIGGSGLRHGRDRGCLLRSARSAPRFAVAVVLLALLGFGVAYSSDVALPTFIQARTPGEMPGRATSVLNLPRVAPEPVSLVLTGALAAVDVRWAFAAASLPTLAVGLGLAPPRRRGGWPSARDPGCSAQALSPTPRGCCASKPVDRRSARGLAHPLPAAPAGHPLLGETPSRD
jgi:hypothetical protein